MAASVREGLLQAKLDALVSQRWGPAVGAPVSFPGGAGLLAPDHGPAYVLVEDAGHRSLGGVVAWALRHQATRIEVLAEAPVEVAAVLQRRALPFAVPITIWRVEGRALIESRPSGLPPTVELPAEAARFADVLRAAGAEPVVELGVLTGEVRGLEVARLVFDDSGCHLEAGVGSQDREAHRALFPDRSFEAQLAEVVAYVRERRTAGARAHVANTVGAERWLRSVLVDHPDLVGTAWLAPVPPTVRRTDLRLPAAALAAGVDNAGGPVLVAASVGIDLDLVPAAADGRVADGRTGCRLILAVGPADDHPRTRQLAAALTDAAEVIVVPGDWKGLSRS